MTCPQVPMGLAAACDWALMVPCLFGDVTKPPSTIFVHTLMLPVRHIPQLTFKSFTKNTDYRNGICYMET